MSGKKFHVSRVIWGVPLVLVALLALAFFQGQPSGPAAAQADAPQLAASVSSAEPAEAVAPVKVVLSDVPQASAADLRPGDIRSHTGVSDAEYAARKQSALTPDKQQPLEAPMDEPAFRDAGQLLSPGRHYSWYGIPATGWTPSDMAVAAGPIYVVQVVNESIGIYTRSGVVQAGYPKTLQAWLCGGCGNSLFDPRAFFDWYNRRYVVLVDRDNGAATSSFYIAASQTSDPRGAWNIYHIGYGGAAGDFGDYPTLGYDWQGIYTCFNTFNPGFTGNKCFYYQKSRIYAGLGLVGWVQGGFNVGGTQVDTLQPVKTMENDKPRAEFMVNSYNILFGGGQCVNGCSGLVVWSVAIPSWPGSGGPGPVTTGLILPTGSYSLPPNADAIGCPGCIDTLDTRISAVPTYHAGSIWAALVTKVGNPARAGIRWWEIGVALSDNGGGCVAPYVNYCPTLTGVTRKQQGLHWYGSAYASFPAIQPDDENNIIMAFAYSNSARNPSSVYTGRRINYTLNTFHDGGYYAAVGGGTRTVSSRWGDYFDTSVDQQYKPYRMWFSAQVSTGTNSWTTHVDQTSFYYPNWP